MGKELAGQNICLFTGQLKSFRAMLVGEYKDLYWGFGTLLLPDPQHPSTGQEINIQAWEEKAQLLSELKQGSWIKISTVFQPTMYKGKEQSNFVIGNITILDETQEGSTTT